jgi:hypothetical protein
MAYGQFDERHELLWHWNVLITPKCSTRGMYMEEVPNYHAAAKQIRFDVRWILEQVQGTARLGGRGGGLCAVAILIRI